MKLTNIDHNAARFGVPLGFAVTDGAGRIRSVVATEREARAVSAGRSTWRIYVLEVRHAAA